MSKINIAQYHTFSPLEAFEKVHNLLKSLKEKYGNKVQGFEEKWNMQANFSLTVQGQTIKGGIVIKDNFVQVYSDELPFMVATFAGDTIKSNIETELKKLLE